MEKIRRALALYINYFLRQRTPTLVYSVERSGSVALLHSLQSHGAFAIGAHYLDPKKLSQQRHSGTAGWGRRKPAKIISLVRSPIENMLSTFAREDFGQPTKRPEEAAEQTTPEQLSNQFCQDYLQADRYLHLLGWFETEFQAALGIDVYQHTFDKTQKFACFREGPYEVLILRTEMDENQKATLVADFVGIPHLEISSAALVSKTSASAKRRRLSPGKPGDQTDYAAKYKTLKQHVVIPQEYLEAIVNSQYAQHFFSEEERLAIKMKYERKPSEKR